MKFENIETSLENDPEYQKRLDAWEEMERRFTEPDDDGSGYDYFDNYSDDEKISSCDTIEEKDWKIRKLVVGLNLIGVETNFSCAGHIRGVVRFLSKGYVDDDGNERLEEIENPPIEGAWSNPYVGFILQPNKIFARTERGQRKLDRKEYMAVTKLQSLIDEFYQERGDDLPEVRVRLKEHESRYSDYEIVCSDAEETKSISGSDDYDELKRLATKRLELEQRDIEEFSEFLKKKYLETGFHL